MRTLIGAMKVTADGMAEGPEGVADWVGAWSEDFGLTAQVDACLLGSAMYAGYEPYWTAIARDPDTPVWITGQPPTPGEVEWARFAAQTPHYVLSRTLTSATWANTSFLRDLGEVAALKQQAGKDIYAMGGARTLATLIDAGLLDELRLIVHPLIAGDGTALFDSIARRDLELRHVQRLDGGRVSLVYGIGEASGPAEQAPSA